MSAPDRSLERQKRRHWPVLIFILVAVLISTFAFLGVLGTDESEENAGPSVEPAATATDAEEPVAEEEAVVEDAEEEPAGDSN